MNDANNNLIRVATLMLLSTVLLTGCMSFNPKSLRSMEAALQESNPDLQIESSMKFGFGALTMDFVDFAFVHDSSIDVSKISRADIGIYELRGEMDISGFVVPHQLGSNRSCPIREVIVRVREENEQVEVVACIKDDRITGLAVFVLEPRELVVINARGDFESLINKLVRDKVGGGRRYEVRVDEERGRITLLALNRGEGGGES